MHQDLTTNSSNSSVTSIGDKAKQNLSSVLDMDCDVACCLDKYSVPGKQSGSVVIRTLCDISDILSLVDYKAESINLGIHAMHFGKHEKNLCSL